MPKVTLEETYTSSWGVVAHRRDEIENGPFGAFERIMREEIDRTFVAIEEVARRMVAHPSTARNSLTRCDCRYITRDGRNFYHHDDVGAMIEMRQAIKRSRKEDEV